MTFNACFGNGSCWLSPEDMPMGLGQEGRMGCQAGLRYWQTVPNVLHWACH